MGEVREERSRQSDPSQLPRSPSISNPVSLPNSSKTLLAAFQFEPLEHQAGASWSGSASVKLFLGSQADCRNAGRCWAPVYPPVTADWNALELQQRCLLLDRCYGAECSNRPAWTGVAWQICAAAVRTFTAFIVVALVPSCFVSSWIGLNRGRRG